MKHEDVYIYIYASTCGYIYFSWRVRIQCDASKPLRAIRRISSAHRRKRLDTSWITCGTVMIVSPENYWLICVRMGEGELKHNHHSHSHHYHDHHYCLHLDLPSHHHHCISIIVIINIFIIVMISIIVIIIIFIIIIVTIINIFEVMESIIIYEQYSTIAFWLSCEVALTSSRS